MTGRPGDRRAAAIVLDLETLHRVVAMPDGWRITAVQGDFLRDAILLRVEGDDLDPQPPEAELPKLRTRWEFGDDGRIRPVCVRTHAGDLTVDPPSVGASVEWLTARLRGFGAEADVIHPDGRHEYHSTHCRHGSHDTCAATTLRDDAGNAINRKPAQCKTCAAPCVCECHTPRGAA